MINETLPFCLLWSIEKKNGTAGGTQLSLDNVRPEQQKMSLSSATRPGNGAGGIGMVQVRKCLSHKFDLTL